MPKSEQQQGAADKYLREKVDTFVVRVPKGEKAKIQAHAAARKESLNGYATRVIAEAMERDIMVSEKKAEWKAKKAERQKK